MDNGSALDAKTAGDIYDVLEAACGAPSRGRDHFIHGQTHGFVSEWRFMGALGFGGKFWRTPGHRPDGSWGECWLVNQYPKDVTPESAAMVADANERLSTLLAAEATR